MSNEYTVVSPAGEPVVSAAEPRRPVVDMNQAVVAELWDDRFYGDEIYATLREELKRRYPGIRVIEHTVFGNTHGFDEDRKIAALPDMLAAEGCTAALSAVGA